MKNDNFAPKPYVLIHILTVLDDISEFGDLWLLEPIIMITLDHNILALLIVRVLEELPEASPRVVLGHVARVRVRAPGLCLPPLHDDGSQVYAGSIGAARRNVAWRASHD